jgi:methylated-DNA-[protein]-cysteine S-methyltransferase
MPCESVSVLLDAFRTGELSGGEKEFVSEHLDECRTCSTRLESIESMAAAFRGLRRAAPPGLLERVVAATQDQYGGVETDLGLVWVGFNVRGILMAHLGTRDPGAFEKVYRERLGRRATRGSVPERYAQVIRQAAAGDSGARPPVDLSGLPPFEQEVLRMLARIPRGEVRSYAWLAREIGRPKAVRAVGNALAKNPVPLLLPCHRVVPSSGGVGNYIFGAETKREILEREGVPIGELEKLSRQGVRYLGCSSTKIYCHPTCRHIRRARPENRIPLADERAAVDSGFRPCQHCRPLASAA